jgi:hypothetical protein
MKATGEDHRIYVTAEDSDRAAHVGMSRGMLVASVSPLVASELASAVADHQRYRPPPPIAQATPNYTEIQTGATWLAFIAACVQWMGVALIVLGVGNLVLAGIAAGTGHVTALEHAVRGLVLIVIGVLHLAAAAIMRMFASIGRAIRDIAQNSHH